MKAIALLLILTAALMTDAQTLFDSFDDGNFTSAPAWSGDDANWTIVANSDAAAGAVGSNTLRLNVGTSVSGTQYLSAAVTSWGSNQEWGFWVGRRNQAFTATNQMHIWLYANEANLKSPTVDGYRLVIGDNSGDDEIVLQVVTDGAPTAILTSAQAIPNGLRDFGFLIRVTRNISGDFELFTSTLPAADGTGAVATDIPNTTNANISQGTANNTLYTPSGTGYIGIVAIHATAVDARQAVELDQIYFTASSPDIIVTGGPLTFGNIEIGKVSAEQTYSVSGTGLSGNITITAPTHFQISTTSGAGFSSSLTLTPTSGTVSSTTIYVRMSPSAAGNISGVITHTSAGASQEDVAVSGTGVVTPVCTISDDFTDNNFTSAPSWTGNTTGFAVISSATIPNGSATTDGAYLASNASVGHAALTTSSAITSEWRFSLATPSFSPSDNNYFGIILMSDVALTGDITATSWNGYYLRIGDNAPGTDKMKLYRRTGMTSTLIGEFPASPSFSASALSGGLNLRITRDPSTGEFEVFYSSGFLYGAVPTVSAGKLTDATHSTSTYFGVFQRFNNPGTDKRIYFDHLCAFERAYVWLPVSGVADWTNASNWSPPRTSPANSDILLFNRGGASVASNIPTSETVRQIHISNNTQVSLRAAGISGASLTISGAPGDDFVVETGSKLIFDSHPGTGTGFPVVITLGPKATGSVSGNITFDKTTGNQADHRLLTDKSGSDSSFVVFNSGAVFHAKDFNGDPFGTSGPRNTFIFTSGSLYVKDAGNVPFGLNQPESKVVFQSGSTYQHKSGFPSFAGRSYGNFELNISGSLNISTGSAAGCSVENFTVTSGTLNFPMNANNTPQNFDITGTLSVASGATFNYSPNTASAASLFRFTGSNGTIAGSGTIIFGSNSTLEFAGDVSIAGASVQVEGSVARKSGTVSVIGGGGMVYGANSALLYNGTSSLTASAEWPNVGSSTGPATITVENGTKTITLSGNKEVRGKLFVKTNNTLASGGNLVLQPGAVLMHGSGTPNGGGNVTGSVTVRQEGFSSNIRYNYWSSPVSGADVSILGGNLYYYDPSSAADLTLNGWLLGWIPASGTMQPGKGYASTGGGIVSFSGTVNNAPSGSPITIAVEKNDGVANNVGFNLIGNPFPSAVSASDFVAANSGVIAGALYFWDDDGTGGTGSNWGMGQDYAVWTGAGAVGPNSGKTFTGHIASGQGFFVEKLANGVASVQFTNSMRTTNNDVFFRQQALQRFWISVTNPDGAYNETLLAFLDDATDGPDVLYDAKKLKGNPFIALYSKIGNEDYAIQALPLLETDRTIALGLDAATPGQHVLRLKLAEGLDETVVIMLEDRINGVFQNLRQNPEYIFTTTAGQNLERFFLHLNPEAEFILTDETCAGNDGVLELVQPGSKTWNYTITSESGTIVSSGTLSGSIVLNNLVPGTYHAELVDAGGYRVLKDFVLGSKQLVKAAFQPSATEVFINEPVYFANLSTGEAVYRWDFGDGSIAEGVVHPQHIFTEEGVYRIQLFASTQDCQDIAQAEIRVRKAVVGITEPGIGGVRVFHSGNRIFVNKGPDSGIMRIVITNLLGQKCYDFKTDNEISVITLQEAESKIYFVTTMQDGTVHTQKLLIIR